MKFIQILKGLDFLRIKKAAQANPIIEKRIVIVKYIVNTRLIIGITSSTDPVLSSKFLTASSIVLAKSKIEF